MKPKNQYQQVIYYLMNMNNFSLADVISDSMFYKFQTRLSDVEAEHGVIARRTKRTFINRFGRKCTYSVYNSCVRQSTLEIIFNSYD